MPDHSYTAEQIDRAAEISVSKNRNIRLDLFDALNKTNEDIFLCSHAGRWPLVVNARDPVIGRGLFVDGAFADFHHFQWIIEKIKKRGELQETLIDIGANIGPICVPAVAGALFSRAAAIEPHPLNCKLLRANIALNGLQDSIKLYEAALGVEADGHLEIEISQDNPGDHRVHVNASAGLYGELSRDRLTVRTKSLDEIYRVEGLKDAFIWMDVQGYEGQVLAGASTILRDKPPIFLEFWPYGLDRAKSFGMITDAVKHYSGFFDAEDPTEFFPISALQNLYDKTGLDGKFTDILLL